ncbi:MAG: hypothetical protein HYV62_07760 [Candidatus Rokubacteria bacterium]|nr:hypothetical protein [Candidatus Rokubacteria bacterium]
MRARRHWLTIGLTTGVILATGLAFAEPSKTPDEWTFDETKAFSASSSQPTTVQGAPSEGAPVAGDASVRRPSPARAQAAPSTGVTGRTFQSDYPSLGR